MREGTPYVRGFHARASSALVDHSVVATSHEGRYDTYCSQRKDELFNTEKLKLALRNITLRNITLKIVSESQMFVHSGEVFDDFQHVR